MNIFLSIEPISEYVERMGLQESMFPEALSQQIEVAEILKKIENIFIDQYRIDYNIPTADGISITFLIFLRKEPFPCNNYLKTINIFIYLLVYYCPIYENKL